MQQDLTRVSKYLSFILRHRPDSIGLSLDANGWASIRELVDKSSAAGLTHELLEIAVATNDKQRFAISADGDFIRANQGHSIEVELDLTPVMPPEQLLHGTATRFWSSIQAQGLQKGQRHHVHLTESRAVAQSVGSRYGQTLLLGIRSGAMHEAGFKFFKTANHVWLVERVPIEFIRVIHDCNRYQT